MAGPTIASAEVDVDFDGSRMPAQARRIANQAGKNLAPKMRKVGDRVGREFITGMDGRMRQVPANAMRAIREINTREIGRDKGEELAGALGDGVVSRSHVISSALAKSMAGGDFDRQGNLAGRDFSEGLQRRMESEASDFNAEKLATLMLRRFSKGRAPRGWFDNAIGDAVDDDDFDRRGRRAGSRLVHGMEEGVESGSSRIEASVKKMLSGIGGGSGGGGGGGGGGGAGAAGEEQGNAFGGGFRRGILGNMDRTTRLVLNLIAGLGPQMAALGSSLSATLVGTLGSAIVGLGGAFLILGGPLLASLHSFLTLKNSWKSLQKSSAELKAAVKDLSGAWKEQKKALGEAAVDGILPLFEALTKLISKADFGKALGKSVASIADAFTEVTKSPGFSAFLTAMETTFPKAMALFGAATASITQALLTMWASAGPAAVAMGESFKGWAASFADAMQTMADSGQLAAFFDQALASMDALFGVVNPLAVALGNVFLIGSGPANEFLGILGDLSGQFLAFTRSAEGVTAITDWFVQANTIGVPLLGLIGSLGKTLATMVTPHAVDQLVEFINALSKGLPIIGELLSVIGEDFGVLEIFTQALRTIGTVVGPLLPAFSAFATILGQGLLDTLKAFTPVLAVLADVFTVLLDPLGRIVGGLTDFSSASAFAANAARVLPGAIFDIGATVAGLVDTIARVLPDIVTALTGVLAGLGVGLANAFRTLGPAVGNMLGVLVEQLGKLLPVVITVATEAFGGLVTGLVAAIPSFVDALSLVLAAVLTLVPVLLEGALTLVIALVEGLAANAPMIAEALVTALTAAVGAITTALPLFVAAAVELVGGLAQGLLENLPVLVEAVGGLIGALILAIGNNLPVFIAAAVEIIGALAIGMRQSGPLIVEALLALLPAFTAAVQEAMPLLIEVGTTILDGLLRGLIENEALISAAIIRMSPAIIKAVTDLLPLWIDLGFGIIRGIAKGIADHPELAVDAIKLIVASLITAFKQQLGISSPSTVMAGLGTDVMNGLRNGITTAGEAVITYFTNLPGNILAQLQGLGGRLSAWATDAMNQAKDGFRAGISGLVETAKGIPGQIAGAIGYLGSTLYNAGANLIAGLVDGVVSGIGGLLETVGSVAQQVVDKVTGKKPGFEEGSPSKVFRRIGGNVVAGLVQGLESDARSVDAAAAALARGSIGSFDNAAPTTQVYGDTHRNNNVAAGAIQIVTQTTDPVIAANMVLDRLVTRMT